MSGLSHVFKIKDNCDSAFRYLFLILLCFSFYFISLNFGFIWDDYTYIVNNLALDQPGALVKIWTSHAAVDFWPLSYSLFWLQKQLFGSQASGYHATNLLLFTLSVIFLYKLLKKLNLQCALVLSVIFAIHPMNVAAVSWIFQAKTNLANIFGLLSCLYFVKFCNQEKLKYYLSALLFISLSLLSKISLVMLPVLYLLYLFTINKFDLKKKLLVTLPFLIISTILGLTNLLWGQNSLPVPDSELILDKSILFRIVLVGQNFLFYIYQTFFPKDLMFVPAFRSGFEIFFFLRAKPDFSCNFDLLPLHAFYKAVSPFKVSFRYYNFVLFFVSGTGSF